MRRVLVDFTPLGPRGENGGSRLVATTLVREMARLAPDTDFVLATSAGSHAELATLDAPNVTRHCVQGAATGAPVPAQRRRLRGAVTAVVRSVPEAARVRLKARYWAAAQRRTAQAVVGHEHPQVVLSPFGAARFLLPGVPFVTTVYDLQHRVYPAYFSRQQRYLREAELRRVCRHAERLLCISDFVRRAVLGTRLAAPERVQTVTLPLLRPTPSTSQAAATAVLQPLGLRWRGYFVYPANFWPHKNHRRLLQAMRAYADTGGHLTLVCTGEPGTAFDHLRAYAGQLGLESQVLFPGYLDDQQAGVLTAGSYALVYPSLYEGFGLPVLEGMAAGRPVLCSQVASLPEVGGDAVLYFDPEDVQQIAGAMLRVQQDGALAARLAAAGPPRAAAFGTPADLAAAYLGVLSEVAAGAPRGRR